MASAFGALGADPSIGHCACLRRELSGEPDAGNLHLRFDEGRVGRATGVAFSPTLPEDKRITALMSVDTAEAHKAQNQVIFSKTSPTNCDARFPSASNCNRV